MNTLTTDLIGTKMRLYASFGGDKPKLIQNESVTIRAVWLMDTKEGPRVLFLVLHPKHGLMTVTQDDLKPEETK